MRLKFLLSALLLLFFILPTLIMAQTPDSNVWSKGRVMLTNQDTLKGIVNYNPNNDLLQINIDNTIKTFSAQQVNSFDFWDQTQEKVRYFRVYPYSIYSNYKTPVFFEVLLDGSMTLLLRERYVTERVRVFDPYSRIPMYGDRVKVESDFYFLNTKTDKIREYRQSKRDLLSILKDKQNQISTFVKANRLNYKDKKSLTRIVEYYNSLASNQQEHKQ